MALLTQSEAVAFNGFLSSVDFSDVLEWSALADGHIPIPPAPEKGKEAVLAKAAKDLMALEPTNIHHDNVSSLRSSFDSSTTTVNTSWPSLPGDTSTEQRRTHSYTYGFGAPSRNSHKIHLPNVNPPGGPSQAIPDNLFSFPSARSHSPARSSSSSSSPYSFNTASTTPTIDGRPSPYPTSSSPSLLTNQRPQSSSKRNLPHDGESWHTHAHDGLNSHEPTSKRRRPSVVSPTSPIDPPTRSRGTRASSTSSSSIAGPSSLKTHEEGTSNPSNGTSKPALLSPSQKRANHIQSEQKRRANIRRGYEALCDAVPALREAIKAEEEAARAADEEGSRTKRKRKGKGAAEEAAEKVGDGRAGPKSENVVLQKTIDHLHALLASRTALKERLTHARNILPPSHPAQTTEPKHLDEKGVPLWEREWNGGTGWKDGEEEGDDE